MRLELRLDKQELYHLQLNFALVILKTESLELFAQAGLDPPDLSLPRS
jgi:hypothetical protein